LANHIKVSPGHVVIVTLVMPRNGSLPVMDLGFGQRSMLYFTLSHRLILVLFSFVFFSLVVVVVVAHSAQSFVYDSFF